MKAADQASLPGFPSPEIVVLLRDVTMTFDGYATAR